MKFKLPAFIMFCLLSGLIARADITVYLSPENDGYTMSTKSGLGNSWETHPFDETSATVWATYDYNIYPTGIADVRQAYLQVALAALPDPELIVSATLYFYVNSIYHPPSGVGGKVASISQVNSASANGHASQTLSAKTGATQDILYHSTGWYSYDFTLAIINDLINGHAYSAFIIIPEQINVINRPDQVTFLNHFSFYAADYSDEAFHPYLEIVMIPEPSCQALALGGILVATTLRRRKSTR